LYHLQRFLGVLVDFSWVTAVWNRSVDVWVLISRKGIQLETFLSSILPPNFMATIQWKRSVPLLLIGSWPVMSEGDWKYWIILLPARVLCTCLILLLDTRFSEWWKLFAFWLPVRVHFVRTQRTAVLCRYCFHSMICLYENCCECRCFCMICCILGRYGPQGETEVTADITRSWINSCFLLSYSFDCWLKTSIIVDVINLHASIIRQHCSYLHVLVVSEAIEWLREDGMEYICWNIVFYFE
jgi:hypothetical protein